MDESTWGFGVLRVWSPWIGMSSRIHLNPPCFCYITSFLPHLFVYESLDDDCTVSPEAKDIFLTRIHDSFGLRHDDNEIRFLTGELQALLCHNANLNGE